MSAELALSVAGAERSCATRCTSMTELQRKAKDDAVFLPSARSAADLACRLRADRSWTTLDASSR